ncbi:MAG: hypothetical protein WBX22_16270 [Silvibacterium sp.]
MFAGAIFRFRCHLGKPNPAGSMLIDLGVGYLTNGDIEKAETANPKALELQPDDSVALENGVGLSGILKPCCRGRGNTSQGQSALAGTEPACWELSCSSKVSRATGTT